MLKMKYYTTWKLTLNLRRAALTVGFTRRAGAGKQPTPQNSPKARGAVEKRADSQVGWNRWLAGLPDHANEPVLLPPNIRLLQPITLTQKLRCPLQPLG